jgi:hypothetical protein
MKLQMDFLKNQQEYILTRSMVVDQPPDLLL